MIAKNYLCRAMLHYSAHFALLHDSLLVRNSTCSSHRLFNNINTLLHTSITIKYLVYFL